MAATLSSAISMRQTLKLAGAALTLAGSLAMTSATASAQSGPRPTCPPNYSLNGNICERYLTQQPSCPRGWRFSRGRCERLGGGHGGGGHASGCRYRGSRGYDNPRGNTCRANYPITAREDFNLDVIFRSDGRTWRWGETRSGWDLLSVTPATKFGTSGNMQRTRNGFSGWFESGFCGRGWIDLQLIRGSC